MTNALDGAVVGIAVPHVPTRWQLVAINGKAMILRRNDAALRRLPVLPLQTRLIGSAVTVLQFERITSDSECEELVPETNAERRNIFCDRPLDLLNGCIAPLWVPRTITEEESIVLEIALGEIVVPRYAMNAYAALQPRPQNITFDAAIVCDDRRNRTGATLDRVGVVCDDVAARHFCDEVQRVRVKNIVCALSFEL